MALKKNSISAISSSILFIALVVLFCPCPSPGASEPYIPALLKPWRNWVLHDYQEQIDCIPSYNNTSDLYCVWPTRLDIDLTHNGGQFQQAWLVQTESWVSLPGAPGQWPLEVRIDDKPAIVIEKNECPQVLLLPGNHTIAGKFTWLRPPEYLQIPPQSALVALTVDDAPVDFPNVDRLGRLWLKTLAVEEKIEHRLKIESYRLIEDTIPAQVTVLVMLDVAGAAREVTLGPIYDPQYLTPMSLTSPLPARLEQNGQLRVQVRPGRFDFTIVLRHHGPLEKMSFSTDGSGFWPDQEIWSFANRPNLRIVEIGGAASIDPLQTSVPKNWQHYPAYRMLPGDAMVFKEIKRGDPHPAPDQLTLDRSLWLRFDGSGYTIQDVIDGKKNTHWCLEMTPEITLGRVAVDGREQFITKRRGSNKAGIELRKGKLHLMADSTREGGITALPATGWDHDFQSVRGKLYLPPGWKLISASGFDNIPRTWMKRWTLLDFFVVLIFTITVAKLFSKPMSGISFLTLVLIYHEPNAPKFIWLALLIGFALLKYLPEGRLQKTVKIYQILALVSLIVITIPYAIEALRIGIYPQLARPLATMGNYSEGDYSNAPHTAAIPKPGPQETQQAMLPSEDETDRSFMDNLSVKSKAPGRTLLSQKGASRYEEKIMRYDPNALTQTGPGMPAWEPFETIYFSWSGPVTRDQSISFVLIGPKTNLVFAFVRVFLIILLALGMFGVSYWPGRGIRFNTIFSSSLLPFTALFVLLFAHSGLALEIPSPEMLDKLRTRLLEKNECFPGCASISNSAITITPDNLNLTLQVDAQVDTAVPLPSHTEHWLPQKIRIDGQSATGLFRNQTGLWALMPEGKHMVTLSGRIRQQNTLQLPFLLKPHHVTIHATGWSVEGLRPDDTLEEQLQFKRISEQENATLEVLETGVLPPFVLVERNLLLGLIWKVETTIQRRSPAGSAVILNIPLLPGESVTTEGVSVKNGVAQVTLGANQAFFKWESFLALSETIPLTHPETADWTEIWKVDVSPIFHMAYDGIPVIMHQLGNRWHPTWHPWPGETVQLTITRPSGVEGRTLTIERSHLVLHPGQRSTDAELILGIKSSQGGQHTISLPTEASLQEVKINAQVQPIRQEGSRITFPIIPGNQKIEVKWRESGGIKTTYETAQIDLGAPSVNSSTDVHLPRNRWPLFMGGAQLVGPAVLFWSVLFVVVLVAFGLSKTGLTPLGFYEWLLLGIGMSMSNLAACLLVVAWLMALALKGKKATETLEKNHFNLVQIGILILTLLAMGALLFAISNGLLGHPDMNIIGNGSHRGLLKWYHDISGNTLPQAWVISIPMLAYRSAMLAWALWVSFWLVGIIRWGWQQFSTPILWYPSKKREQAK